MLITSGKHEGKTSQQVVLKFPDYVEWYVGQFPNSQYGKEFVRLVKKLNGKSFTEVCYDCGEPATRATAYQNNPQLYFWCDTCNPYGSGANAGKLQVIKSFDDALDHIDATAGGHKQYKRDIIINLARGKGLPKRVTQAAAAAFFI